MTQSDAIKNVATAAGLAVVYFVAGKLGLEMVYVHASGTAVWACTGIAVAALLVYGYRVWAGILIGAFLVNLTTAGAVATSIAIAGGNTLEALAGCYLVNRFAHGKEAFQRAHDIFKFALLAGMIATVVSATIGVATLAVSGLAGWAAFGSIWCTWWLGDAVGAVLVTPLLLLWWESPRPQWTREQITELAFLFIGLFATAWSVFGEPFHSELKNYPLEYLCVPFLVWAAYRFGRREAATALCALAGMATWGTLHGFGPFAREARHTSLLVLQTFLGLTAVTALTLAADVWEHRRGRERGRTLAGTDAFA